MFNPSQRRWRTGSRAEPNWTTRETRSPPLPLAWVKRTAPPIGEFLGLSSQEAGPESGHASPLRLGGGDIGDKLEGEIERIDERVIRQADAGLEVRAHAGEDQ